MTLRIFFRDFLWFSKMSQNYSLKLQDYSFKNQQMLVFQGIIPSKTNIFLDIYFVHFHFGGFLQIFWIIYNSPINNLYLQQYTNKYQPKTLFFKIMGKRYEPFQNKKKFSNSILGFSILDIFKMSKIEISKKNWESCFLFFDFLINIQMRAYMVTNVSKSRDTENYFSWFFVIFKNVQKLFPIFARLFLQKPTNVGFSGNYSFKNQHFFGHLFCPFLFWTKSKKLKYFLKIYLKNINNINMIKNH